MNCEKCGSPYHTTSICPQRHSTKRISPANVSGEEACLTVDLERDLKRALKHKKKARNNE